jgi:GNAT superfamily N-acetyltransferase
MMIRHATPRYLHSILELFDSAVVWLVARGITKQWGTEPLSQSESFRARVQSWIDKEEMVIAAQDDLVLGCLAVCASVPPYAQQVYDKQPKTMLYLEAFVTHREHKGQGVGQTLLMYAEQLALEKGIAYIWLDCYAENSDLQKYYEGAGFVAFDEFRVGEWRGKVFEKRLMKINEVM